MGVEYGNDGLKVPGMDDIEKLLARKIFEVLRVQAPGDVAELRFLALKARERGYGKLADEAESMASLFEAEDATRK